MLTIGLVGNPNSGKSTVFNALTGARQRVGNWPGVTVERKSGQFVHEETTFEVIDLPGTYSLDPGDATEAIDERIAREFLSGTSVDVIVNVIDATSLSRGIFLTTQLLEQSTPVVVALNMLDSAEQLGIEIDVPELAKALGCPVIPLVATRSRGIEQLKDSLSIATHRSFSILEDSAERYALIDDIVKRTVVEPKRTLPITDRIDQLVLNRYLAFPFFLGVMYLMFMFTINVGSAFIDFFDIAGNALFVEGPRTLLEKVGLPVWLVTFLADGVGGGIQLVGTFIPVIACLFLFLTFLEDTGYMARAAFVLDRLMQRLGLPGKSFVPLIVGFGCNVPAVMATRSLDNQPDRILTTIMAPFMSCGARLTVYALFAAAFFPSNGQNIVFALYFFGIAVAVVSAMVVRRHLLHSRSSAFILELPAYHLPTVKGILIHTWQRLSGFVTRAGKAIVMVVIVLNVVNSVGTDGSFGNENTKDSVLSSIGRTITPAFRPMGISDDNWPATVGIFAGIFAKEVVVGTLDALYSETPVGDSNFNLLDEFAAATQTIPNNLSALVSTVTDPLGLDLGELDDTSAAATNQAVEINTITAMRSLFDGELGAFSYLLFVLLYMPCVATIGAIYKELGSFWAVFSTAWSVVIAYAAAVVCYQLGGAVDHPLQTLFWCISMIAMAAFMFTALIRWGVRRAKTDTLIPVLHLE
jgi:ferrous iron transport protein B